MRVADTPITEVSRADIGQPVSYQVALIAPPRHGKVAGMSHHRGMVFIRFDGDQIDTLSRFNDLRWGHVEQGWLQPR